MQFNPLFININPQPGGAENLNLNRFNNVSYLFKDIIKVNLNSNLPQDALQPIASDAPTESLIYNVSQISVNEDEVKNIIAVLFEDGSSSSLNDKEISKSKRIIDDSINNEEQSTQAPNNIIGLLDAGKVVKINFSDLQENYSIQISKSDLDNLNVNENSADADKNILPNLNTANVDILSSQIPIPKQNEIKIVDNSPAFKSNIIKNIIEKIISGEGSELSSDNILEQASNAKNNSSDEIENINLNNNRTEKLFEGLKALIDNKENYTTSTNNSGGSEYKINIVKQSAYENKQIKSAFENLNSVNVIKLNNEKSVMSSQMNVNDEKFFEVSLKQNLTAQKDFVKLEQNNTRSFKIFTLAGKEETKPLAINSDENIPADKTIIDDKQISDLNFISTDKKAETQKPSDISGEIKSTTTNKIQFNSAEIIKDTETSNTKVKTDSPIQIVENEIESSPKEKIPLNADVKIAEKEFVKNVINDFKLGENISIKSNEKRNIAEKFSSNKNEIKTDEKKLSEEPSTKINIDNKESIKPIHSNGEAKEFSEVKNILVSDSKENNNFNQSSNDKNKNEDGTKSLNTNSVNKNLDKDENVKAGNEKVETNKSFQTHFNSELKTRENLEVKDAKAFSNFDNQLKNIKPSEIIKEISNFIQKGEHKSVVLNLSPENLGKVKVIVDMVDKTLHANIEVENESVKQTVQTNVEQLKSALMQSGITLAGLTISLNNTDDKNNKASESKRKTSSSSNEEIKTEVKITNTIPKKMGYNTYEFLA